MSGYSYAISPTIGIALSSIVVYYMYSLEKLGCACSLTTKRAYILGFNAVLIAFNLFVFAMGGIDGLLKFYAKYPVLYVFPFLMIIGTLVNITFTIEFVNDMKREKCDCSDSVFKDIMYILSIIQAVTWSILGLIILVMGGLLTKDIATGKINIKNIQKAMSKKS